MVVYDNAVVVAESGGKHVQMQIGTLVRAGDTWRLLTVPQIEGEGGNNGVAQSGGLIRPRTPETNEDGATQGNGPPGGLPVEDRGA